MTSLADLAALASDPVADAAAGGDRRHYRIDIDPVFTIGPKVHGGALQVISAHAARRAFAETAPDPDASGAADLVPVAVSSEYLGAPDPAGVDVVAWIRKRGRRISVVDVEIAQNGRTLVHSSVTLGRADTGQARYVAPGELGTMPAEPVEGGLAVQNSPMAAIINMVSVLDLVFEPRSVPFVHGDVGEPLIRFWARPIGADPDVFFALLSGDLSAPVVMNLGVFGWAPTTQLTTYVRRVPAPGWLRVEASTAEVGSKWFSEDHRILDSTGALVAESRQLALVPTDDTLHRRALPTTSTEGT